jgi:hypothetical protein
LNYDRIIVAMVGIAGLATIIASCFLCARALRAIRSRQPLSLPNPDHPALAGGVARLALKQGIFFLVLGLACVGAGVFVLVVLLRTGLVPSVFSAK